jgi:hypothetical protein
MWPSQAFVVFKGEKNQVNAEESAHIAKQNITDI